MKLSKKIFSAGAIALLISLSACDNDDEKGGQLSKDEAKNEIASFNTSATGDLQALADADGLKTMQDFFDLVDQDDPFGRIGADKNKIRVFLREKGREFRTVFVPSSSVKGLTNGDEPFDFDANKGVYVWNAELAEFVKESEAAIIEIWFPTEGSLTNNAKLQISVYEEQFVEDDFEGFYEPTALEASLFVNESKKASVDLNIDYDDAGFPVTANIEVMVTPYTASLSFDVTASTSSTISFSLLQNQDILIATNVVVNYSDASKTEESLSVLEGYVQFKNLKLQGTVDVGLANEVEEPDFNDIVNVKLYSDGKIVGDIVFVTENEEEIPYVKYADGSTEKLEDVFQPVIDELEALGESLDTEG
jgi:hypothetical protein